MEFIKIVHHSCLVSLSHKVGINFKEFGFKLQRLLNPQCFNLSFPQRIWAWVDKKKK
jgi:hypothetical protein